MAIEPLPLPAPGQTEWAPPLNASLEQLNQDIGNIQDSAETILAAASSATQSAAEAEDAASRAEAVGDTNDAINDGLIGNTSSLTRTRLDGLYSDVVNGALYVVPDGVTDNTTGLASAISVAQSTRKPLLLPPGTILTKSRVITPTGTVVIRGSGRGSTVLKLVDNTTQNSLLTLSSGSSHRVEISDLTLDGNNVALTGDTYTAVLRLSNRGNAPTVISNIEIRNSSTRGIANYLSGAEVVGCWIHDCVDTGIALEGRSGVTTIERNIVERTQNNAIRVGTPSGTVIPGVNVRVCGNTIRDITAVSGGTGEYGNGILIYRVDDVLVSNNSIKNTAWASIRLNRSDNATITANECLENVNQAAIFVEFESSYCTISGNIIRGGGGITVTNANNGAFGNVINANVINIAQGQPISCEHGIVSNNIIEGNNSANAAVRQIPAGVSAISQLTMVNNQIAGCAYIVALPSSNSGATSFAHISGNRVLRKDSSWVGPIAALSGGTTPTILGPGSSIGSAYSSKVHFDMIHDSIADADKPPTGSLGSRLLIDGVVKTFIGSAWS